VVVAVFSRNGVPGAFKVCDDGKLRDDLDREVEILRREGRV
jgi:hypothetical protein